MRVRQDVIKYLDLRNDFRACAESLTAEEIKEMYRLRDSLVALHDRKRLGRKSAQRMGFEID